MAHNYYLSLGGEILQFQSEEVAEPHQLNELFNLMGILEGHN